MPSQFAKEILKRRHTRSAVFPPKQRAYAFLFSLIELMYPHFSGEYEYFTAEEIDGKLELLKRDLKKLLQPQQSNLTMSVTEISDQFFASLPVIYHDLWKDAKAIYKGDPAAKSLDEVISAYPGFFAIYTYRVAHEFHTLGVPILPRLLSEYAHYRTGVDIHPGARIGDSFFIDHGTGVVIGETTMIGKNVKIYQGVSLGALSVSKALSQTKRHPTIEDNVVIYSNATILGGQTVVGHDSVIGGNVWLTRSVPPFSTVYHQAEVKVRKNNVSQEAIDFSI